MLSESGRDRSLRSENPFIRVPGPKRPHKSRIDTIAMAVFLGLCLFKLHFSGMEHTHTHIEHWLKKCQTQQFCSTTMSSAYEVFEEIPTLFGVTVQCTTFSNESRRVRLIELGCSGCMLGALQSLLEHLESHLHPSRAIVY